MGGMGPMPRYGYQWSPSAPIAASTGMPTIAATLRSSSSVNLACDPAPTSASTHICESGTAHLAVEGGREPDLVPADLFRDLVEREALLRLPLEQLADNRREVAVGLGREREGLQGT